MSFVSPIHIIAKWYDPKSFKAEDLKPLKNRVRAEYELTDGYPVKFGGLDLNRHEALNYLELFKNNEYLTNHLVIYNDKPLLDFLEKGNSNFIFTPSSKIVISENIRNIISASFAHNLGQLLAKYVLNGSLEKVRKITSFPFLNYVTPIDERIIYQKTIRVLYGIMQDLNRACEGGDKKNMANTFKKNTARISPYIEVDFIKKLNALPREFEHVRDMIASPLISIACDFNNSFKNYQEAFRFIQAAHALRTGPETKNETERLYRLIKNNKNNTVKSKGSYWYIIIIIIAVFRIARSCDSRHSNSINHMNYPINTTRYNRDSIYRQIHGVVIDSSFSAPHSNDTVD